MANYCCTIRTNYFHVKDDESFEKLMSNVVGEDLHIFNSTDKNGNKTYGFGCYCSIYGYSEDVEDDDYECDYDKFINGLQECVCEDDAVIIFEAGHEKLRYVVGDVMVITSKDVKYESILNIGLAFAKEMLNNPDYVTCTDY